MLDIYYLDFIQHITLLDDLYKRKIEFKTDGVFKLLTLESEAEKFETKAFRFQPTSGLLKYFHFLNTSMIVKCLKSKIF
jgi:hypothetical protein